MKLDKTIEFIQEVVNEMEDIQWQIVGVVDYKEVAEDDVAYAKLTDGSMYEKQDNIYIVQTQEYEDCYTGTIIYPITESKALKIHYNC